MRRGEENREETEEALARVPHAAARRSAAAARETTHRIWLVSHTPPPRPRSATTVRAASPHDAIRVRGRVGPPPRCRRRARATDSGDHTQAESPWRTFRKFIYGSFALSATVGGVTALTQLAAAATGQPDALPIQQAALNVGVDFGVVAACAYRRPSRNLTRWSCFCYALQEDGTGIPTLPKPAETVLARPRSGRA